MAASQRVRTTNSGCYLAVGATFNPVLPYQALLPLIEKTHSAFKVEHHVFNLR
jgi:hypothetical protein